MAQPSILTQQEIEDGLQSLPDWKYQNDKISKQFVFRDFMDSLAFVNKLAPYCERLDHHPDVHISYSKVLFELQRFDVEGKVTDKDFMMAHKIEELYKAKK